MARRHYGLIFIPVSIFRLCTEELVVGWRTGKGNNIAFGAVGCGFDSRANQIAYSVNSYSPNYYVFSEQVWGYAAAMGPATRYTF